MSSLTPQQDGLGPVPPTSVLVCFHAHPDDEVFTTGGVMRLAADAGHRVVLVTATDGALGEVPAFLAMPIEQVEAAFGQESFRRREATTRQPGTAALGATLPL
jgi:LmbE family N-acetylglucosaminyl deacetylase